MHFPHEINHIIPVPGRSIERPGSKGAARARLWGMLGDRRPVPVTTSPVSALRRVARAALLAAAATAAPAAPAALTASCSYNVERPRLHVTRVEWLGLDTQGVTLRATVAAYNPNDFELPLRTECHLNVMGENPTLQPEPRPVDELKGLIAKLAKKP